MTPLAPDRVRDLLERIRSKQVMVVGDVMLDRYVWGRVTRVSPEAPVPVVEVDDEAVRLGGAANVAANVASLGAEPLLVGIAGAGDPSTHELHSIMKGYGLSIDGLVEDPDRPTTVKTRIIAHHQHVVRADRETAIDASGETARRLIETIRDRLPECDAVILQDYNKGTLSAEVLSSALPVLEASGVPVTVDPKVTRFFDYMGVTVFKPNLKEVETALGTRLSDDQSVAEAARILMKRLKAHNVLITRGEQGMTLLEADDQLLHVATRAKRVYDVSGAGDTVIATLTAALAGGADVREAAELANHAAGVVVGEVGVVPITPEGLSEAVTEESD